jgi:hypothetical protein
MTDDRHMIRGALIDVQHHISGIVCLESAQEQMVPGPSCPLNPRRPEANSEHMPMPSDSTHPDTVEPSL